jgi:hypothetical protein
VCCKRVAKRRKGERRKGEERKQETERHTQETEPTQQRRLKQNTAEAAKATQEHKPTGTEKRNNRTRHKAEKARPPKATHTDTKRKSTTAAQNRETRTKERAPCAANKIGSGTNAWLPVQPQSQKAPNTSLMPPLAETASRRLPRLQPTSKLMKAKLRGT